MSQNYNDNKIRLWEMPVGGQRKTYLYLLIQNNKRTTATHNIDWLFKYSRIEYDTFDKIYGKVIAEGDSRDCLAKQCPELFL